MALCAGAAVPACDQPEKRATTDEATTVDELSKRPASFEGQAVSLVGDVDEVLSPTAFELEDGMDFLFEDELLVLTKSPVRFGSRGIEPGDDVIVRGTARTFVSAEIESELGWDLKRHLEVDDLERRPVVIADSIHQINEFGRWSADEPEGTRVGWSAAFLEREPAELAGEPISLDSVQVLSSSGRGMWVGSRLFPVLAILGPEQPRFEAQKWVDLSGTIRRVPPQEVVRDEWAIPQSFLEDLEDEAYYIAVDRIQKAREVPSVIASAVAYSTFADQMGSHLDKLVTGEATVTRVISDRGFYLDNPQGEEVFAVVREDVPFHEMIDIDAGDRIEFEAWSHAPTDPVSGKLEKEAVSAIAESSAFLTMYWRNVSILDPGEKGS